MREGTEQINAASSPLEDTQTSMGAVMVEQNGWRLPATYGDVSAEYGAVRTTGSAGLLDLTSRGRILVGGSEATQFLNGLISNDIKTLAEGEWMHAVFPNVQGRLIAVVRVIRLEDQKNEKSSSPLFLLDTEAATKERVLKSIERFTMAGDFRVTDITNQTVQLSIQGENSVNVIRGVFGDTLPSLAANGSAQTKWMEIDIKIVHTTHTQEDGFDLIAAAVQAVPLWNALREAGAKPVGIDAFEILRIEAGIPRFGVDMDDNNVVSELNLDHAISFTKGCYLGQEIIIRIKHRGHVAKKLTGIIFDEQQEINAGSIIKSTGGSDIGRITSVAFSPLLARTIALGFVKFDYLTAGTNVKVVEGEKEISAQVADLPFVNHLTA